MTTEETELTFVRCPNCRSLIPAIATRCRMCGAQFEKKNEAGEAPPASDPGQSAKQSRVRQRTISASPDEVEQIKRDAVTDTPPDAAFRLGGPARREEPASDPHPATPMHLTDFAPEESEPSNGSGEDDTESTLHSSPIHEPPAEESFQFSEPAQEPEDDWADDTEFGADEETFGEEEEEDDTAGPDLGTGSDQPREAKRRRRRRRRKKNHGGAEGTVGAGSAPANVPLPSGMQAGNAPRPAPEQPRREPEQPRREPEQPRREPEPRREEPRHVETRQPEPRQPEPRQPEPRHSEPRQGSSGPIDQPSKSDGSLVGWLVTYGDNPKGQSTELRAGKFFVGRQKLRANDFIVSDSSVSTPHCMLTAGGADALVVQDLMSESGTFVRRAGTEAFTPVHHPVAVHHGDTLRFGHYELLVSLLPKGRAS